MRSPAAAYRASQHQRSGLSLIEMVVSMGLLAIIMLPIMGLLATSRKVMIAGDSSRNADYARQTALDAAVMRLRGAQRVLRSGNNYVEVLTAGGSTARLSATRGNLIWNEAGVQQTLAAGLSEARFTFGTASGAAPSAGSLLLLEVATQATAQPRATWSSTTLWIKPSI